MQFWEACLDDIKDQKRQFDAVVAICCAFTVMLCAPEGTHITIFFSRMLKIFANAGQGLLQRMELDAQTHFL